MNDLVQPIGVFGGTFDPVHRGHIELANSLYQQLKLTSIHFIPCKTPLLKAVAQASAEQRVAMLQIACQPYPHYIIDSRELDRETPSYMVDTLHSLRKEYPHRSLCLIIGADAYQELPRWHQWQDLIRLAHIIVINRPEVKHTLSKELDDFQQQHLTQNAKSIRETTAGSLLLLQLPPMPYASRVIRQQISQGQSVAQNLPTGVWQYIQQHQLYGKKGTY